MRDDIKRAGQLYKIGLFSKAISIYTKRILLELDSPIQNHNFGTLSYSLRKINRSISFFEKNPILKIYLKVLGLFKLENELSSRINEFIHNHNKLIEKLKYKATLEELTSRKELKSVSLIIVDSVNFERANLAYLHCTNSIKFADSKILTHQNRPEQYVQNIPKINSIEEYSSFLIRDLSDYFDTDFVLIAQWDGFVWNPEMWDDEFLNFDYIGAPWVESALYKGVSKEYKVGNGGFSIRSKRLQEFLKNDPNLPELRTPEDVFIGQINRSYLESKGFSFAPLEIASKFSFEGGEYRKAFGIHDRLILSK